MLEELLEIPAHDEACRDCQRATGSSFAAGMNFPIAAVQVEGDLLGHRKCLGKPIYRHFCPNCGASVICTVEVRPYIIGLPAGTLDEPAVFVSTYESF